MSESISARTLSRKISTLKSFWHFLQKRGYTNQNPTLKIVLPKTKKPIPAFFKEIEMNAVLDPTFIPDNFEAVRNHLILTLFYQTGIRLSELINIMDTDVNFDGATIRVTGKRNKQRIIPISDQLIDEIKSYILKRDYEIQRKTKHLFVRKTGAVLYSKLVYTMVHNAMSEISNLYKRSPHVLRHTFATSLLNGGADINSVKELLGHSSLAATQIYTHTSFEELYNIYTNAHPRAK
jgi:integrase/recombinase XerC